MNSKGLGIHNYFYLVRAICICLMGCSFTPLEADELDKAWVDFEECKNVSKEESRRKEVQNPSQSESSFSDEIADLSAEEDLVSQPIELEKGQRTQFHAPEKEDLQNWMGLDELEQEDENFSVEAVDSADFPSSEEMPISVEQEGTPVEEKPSSTAQTEEEGEWFHFEMSETEALPPSKETAYEEQEQSEIPSYEEEEWFRFEAAEQKNPPFSKNQTSGTAASKETSQTLEEHFEFELADQESTPQQDSLIQRGKASGKASQTLEEHFEFEVAEAEEESFSETSAQIAEETIENFSTNKEELPLDIPEENLLSSEDWFLFETSAPSTSIDPKTLQQVEKELKENTEITEKVERREEKTPGGQWLGIDELSEVQHFIPEDLSPEGEAIASENKHFLPEDLSPEGGSIAEKGEEGWQPLNSGETKTLPSREVILKRLEENKVQTKPIFSEEGDYRLRVGDTIRVSIYGELGTDRTLTIDAHGEISYLLVGRIQAAGLTINELSDSINQEMKKHLQFALVNVVPIEFGGLSYTILGQVRDPGKKSLMGHTTVLDALANANGISVGFFRSQTYDLADLHHAFLARKGEYIPVDFQKLIMEGDMRENVKLEDGDYIFIPSALERNIYVIGEVRLPANIGYLNRETLVGAIAKAGGVTRDANTHVYIVRGSLSCPKVMRVKLDQLLKGCARDVLLKPGDIVYVPRRESIEVENIIYSALRSFVAGFFNVAGEETFIKIEPDAAGTDFDGSVLIIPP